MFGLVEHLGFEIQKLAYGDEEADAELSLAAFAPQIPDWMIVDHYGLGIVWERRVAGVASHILAIDDLGRPHDCDLLLDQNYESAQHSRYSAGIPSRCQLLLGPKFALVRPEFAALRAASLAKSRNTISRILIFMGGIDEQNETCKAISGITESLYRAAHVDVVIGAGNVHRAAVETACSRLPHSKLHIQTEQMAELMSRADLLVCAAGSTNWERCTLGVPALVTILADNQIHVAEGLAAADAIKNLGWYHSICAADYAAAIDVIGGADLTRMSRASAAICDGLGVERVLEQVMQLSPGETAVGAK